ncbi:Histone-lysine N-methyltransferase set-6 [Elasticomyces elasticus]|nr:Histone-lysine N-methyltransferase set-6 [Elasticomyces elasticus]
MSAATKPWTLPSSKSFEVRSVPDAGRAVFAKRNLGAGAPLLSTSVNDSPLSYIILRPYRKEVCTQCLTYDRGREWKIRCSEAGVVFCSEECKCVWLEEHDGPCLAAYKAVQERVKRMQTKNTNDSDAELEKKHVAMLANFDQNQERMHQTATWRRTSGRADVLRIIRQAGKLNKAYKATLRATLELKPDPDILLYLLSGIVTAYKAQQGVPDAPDGPARKLHMESEALLPQLCTLEYDMEAFFPKPLQLSTLNDYQLGYLLLLAVLPAELLWVCEESLVINLGGRASHNAFSIRPEGTTDGEESGEFLGWGVWPEASFFNHSCLPNVKKERRGRIWHFSTVRSADKDEQLCITYLGGDEKTLNVHDRRKRLKEQWGFWCACQRCTTEAGKTEQQAKTNEG